MRPAEAVGAEPLPTESSFAKNDLRDAMTALMDADLFSIDLETTGLDPRRDRILGIAVAVSDKKAWYFDVASGDGMSLADLLSALKPIMVDVDKVAVLHNAKFDLKFLQMAGASLHCKIADTMVLAWMIDENRSHSGRLTLKGEGGLVHELFGVVLATWKESAFNLPLFGKDESEYACDDVIYTLKVWKVLYKKLLRIGLEKCFWDLEMPMVRVLADMELAGMCVSVDVLWSLQSRFQEKCDELETKIRDVVGRDIKVNSPDQMSAYLFGELGLKPKRWMKRGKKGLFSTGVGVLADYRNDFEVVALLLEYRENKKLLSTYVKPFIKKTLDDSDGRIYTSFSQTGTVTGRLSSSNPNLQNLPRKKDTIKKAFVPQPGCVLISSDYSQLELRIMAHQSQDPTMLEIYRTGGDIHQMTQDMLGIDNRVVAKGINFGLIYLMQPPTFKKNLWVKEGIRKSIEDCTKWKVGFFQTYVGVLRYQNRILGQLQDRGWVSSLTGRRRRLKGMLKKDFGSAHRMAVNFTIQGSAADIISIAMRNLDRELALKVMGDSRWFDVRVLMQVHDELVLECPIGLEEECMALVKGVMEGAVELRIPLLAEPNCGFSWEDAK